MSLRIAIVVFRWPDTRPAGSGERVLDSPIGPLYLAYGRARDGSSSLYLYIGEPTTTEPVLAGR